MRSTARLHAAQNASRLSSAQKTHEREIEQRAGEHDRAAPEQLDDRARLACLSRRQGARASPRPSDARRSSSTSSAPRRPVRDCTLPRLPTNCISPSRVSTLSSRTSGAPMCPPRRAALTTESPARAGAARPRARIHAGRHRDAGAGKPEHELVDLFAAHAAPAFAHHVAHVAEHEQVAGQHAGRARDVLRLAGDEAAREACGTCLKGFAASRSAASIFCDQRGGDRDASRSAARSRKLRASSTSPAASACSISRAATAALKCRSSCEFRQPHRIVGRRDGSRAASTPLGRLTCAREREAQRDPERKRDEQGALTLSIPQRRLHLGRD